MIDVTLFLLTISLILFFGYFAQFIFQKFGLPDILFLIGLGFILGPNILNWVPMEILTVVAPFFTTFTLLFLLFDGAFNIKLSSLIKEFSHSFNLTIFNFLISSVVISVIMMIYFISQSANINLQTVLISLLTGFMLGGVSSSYVIPLLQQIKISDKIYSLLTLESALTDVFCIVFSLSIIEIVSGATGAGFKTAFSQIIQSFAVALLVGIIAGIIWILMIVKVLKSHDYMKTIAVLILTYTLAELMNGNGAIAALFFGIVLKNSRQLFEVKELIVAPNGKKASKKKKNTKSAKKNQSTESTIATTKAEEFFYHQISFFLKTFFFVYIGILIDISDLNAIIVGTFISVLIMVSRMSSLVLTKSLDYFNKELINSIFARGIAAAAIAQVAIQMGVAHGEFIAKVSYVVITGTIILSSIRVFITKRKGEPAEKSA